MDLDSLSLLTNLLSIIWLDLVLSGDNALVIGIAASTLPHHLQRRAVIFGLVLATVVRIAFSAMATMILKVPGLLIVGGVALLWVAYRLLRELLGREHEGEDVDHHLKPAGTLSAALISITIADISMSIDNVLAVAAIARDHVGLLVFGLALSIGLMGLGATLILRLMLRYRWISYLGVILLTYIAVDMIYDGWPDAMGLLGKVMQRS